MTKQKEEKIDKLTEELPELKIKYEKEIEDLKNGIDSKTFFVEKAEMGIQYEENKVQTIADLEFYLAKLTKHVEKIEAKPQFTGGVVFSCELNVDHKRRRKDQMTLLNKFRSGRITYAQLEREEEQNYEDHYFPKLVRSNS